MTRLEEILKRCEAATPGPWVTNDTACLSLRSEKTNSQIIVSVSVPYEWEHEWTASSEDITFIAHARTDLPLVTKALQKAVEALRFITTGHERSDDHETAAYSNFNRLKAARLGAHETLAEIEALLRESK